MLQRIRNRKGFTLVELMIVVAIIGILAAIAIPNFLNFRMKAKTAEAKSNLGAVRSLEVAYFAEWNFYVGNQVGNPRVTTALDGAKLAWNTNSRFSILGFAPEGSVFYSYDLIPAIDYPAGTDGFTVNANGDLDDDSLIAIFQVNTTSNEIVKSGDDF